MAGLTGEEEEVAEIQAGLASTPVIVFAFRNIDGDIDEGSALLPSQRGLMFLVSGTMKSMREAGPCLIATKENQKVFCVLPDFGEEVVDWMDVDQEAVEE